MKVPENGGISYAQIDAVNQSYLNFSVEEEQLDVRAR